MGSRVLLHHSLHQFWPCTALLRHGLNRAHAVWPVQMLAQQGNLMVGQCAKSSKADAGGSSGDMLIMRHEVASELPEPPGTLVRGRVSNPVQNEAVTWILSAVRT